MPSAVPASGSGAGVIVLQEWFDDLAVTKDRFTVTLNFSDQVETLVIPFDSVVTFIDPSVKFGLKFDDNEAGDDDGEETFDEGRAEEEAPVEHEGSADVVSLDTFRKH